MITLNQNKRQHFACAVFFALSSCHAVFVLVVLHVSKQMFPHLDGQLLESKDRDCCDGDKMSVIGERDQAQPQIQRGQLALSSQ